MTKHLKKCSISLNTCFYICVHTHTHTHTHTSRKQVLVGMWRNWNHCAMSVGMQNDTAALQNSMAIFQVLKNRITTWSSNFTMRMPKGIEIRLLKKYLGLPYWRSGWESACQCRGHAFEPWSGKIPHAAEQLSPWATITEPARLEPVLRNKRGRDSERPAHRDWRVAPTCHN